ncbi:hypothetical protein F5883DRAFT_675872 [Diaporthe sp. PMI_573]|nr:hypothetical protein F5883DRAFT_675872 [Diaporthaceae sp. PMI_573]
MAQPASQGFACLLAQGQDPRAFLAYRAYLSVAYLPTPDAAEPPRSFPRHPLPVSPVWTLLSTATGTGKASPPMPLSILMPVMISPSERTRLAACAVPAATRPTLKCTFSQHGGWLETGVLISASTLSSRPDKGRAHAPPPPFSQVQRSKAKGPEPRSWRARSVNSPQ